MSTASPSATRAIGSPLVGLIVSNVRPLVELTHLPSMSIWVGPIFTDFADIRAGADAVAVAIRSLRGLWGVSCGSRVSAGGAADRGLYRVGTGMARAWSGGPEQKRSPQRLGRRL